MTQVFYRKWRPQRLDQVVGQEAVTQTLRRSVELGRMAHAYLFCGPRGTGKTSTARIMAKAVNCLSPQGGEPDNECLICVSITEARALDLIEIDAASNRGIDDIRSLRDKVHFTPNEARYKVYVVDEVHMLTEPAFNALLKTLEEPPAHAIFVLATTEAHKVPATIISRCQRFDFRRITLETIVARLKRLCDDEEVEATPEALALIGRMSAGSLRDAENLLEQALVSYGSPLTGDHLRDLLEIGSDERALELVGHVVHRTVKEGLTTINQVATEGSDLRQFHRRVMEHLRCVLLLKSGSGDSLGYPQETVEEMSALAQQTTLEHLVHALKTFAGAEVSRDASSPLPLELALVESGLEPKAAPEMVAAARQATPAPETRRPAPKTAAVSSSGGQRARPVERPSAPVRVPAPVPERPGERDAQRPAAAVAMSEPLRRLESQWDEIVRALRTHKGKRFNLAALLRSSIEREVADGTVTLKYSHLSHQERMQEELEDPQASKVLRETFAKAMDGPYEIRAALADGRSGPRRNASQSSHLVRAAQALGAQVVGEKEEEDDGE